MEQKLSNEDKQKIIEYIKNSKDNFACGCFRNRDELFIIEDNILYINIDLFDLNLLNQLIEEYIPNTITSMDIISSILNENPMFLKKLPNLTTINVHFGKIEINKIEYIANNTNVRKINSYALNYTDTELKSIPQEMIYIDASSLSYLNYKNLEVTCEPYPLNKSYISKLVDAYSISKILSISSFII